MKFFIVALCAISCVLAVDHVPVVLRNDYEHNPESYNYVYETDNGISGQAAGVLKVFDKERAAVVVSGSTVYKGDDGQVYELKYTADENGFHPDAAYLPTPPAPQPIPEYIERSLAYIAARTKA